MRLLHPTQDCFVFRDTAYDIESYHDFPLASDLRQVYPHFKEKMNRRISRFLKTVRTAPVCFVRTQTSRTEAQALEQALREIAAPRFRLLVVNHHQDPAKGVIHEDWGLPRVGSVVIPKGADWRGSDPDWSTIMHGFRGG